MDEHTLRSETGKLLARMVTRLAQAESQRPALEMGTVIGQEIAAELLRTKAPNVLVMALGISQGLINKIVEETDTWN